MHNKNNTVKLRYKALVYNDFPRIIHFSVGAGPGQVSVEILFVITRRFPSYTAPIVI